MPRLLDWSLWEPRFEQILARRSSRADAAHDLAHVRRVVANAKRLAASENARLEIVLPAAWLHDCVTILKDSPQRRAASAVAAQAASGFLRGSAYPAELVPYRRHRNRPVASAGSGDGAGVVRFARAVPCHAYPR